MRDDSHFWDAPAMSGEVIRRPDLTVERVRFERQTIVSGVNVRATSVLPLVSWPDPAPKGPYALVLRRDRIIEIGGPAREDGWDDAKGQAINDVTDGYTVFRITGTAALDLLKCGGFVDLDAPSNSVSRMMFGLPALLYRSEDTDTFLIHVSRVYEEALRHTILSHVEN